MHIDDNAEPGAPDPSVLMQDPARNFYDYPWSDIISVKGGKDNLIFPSFAPNITISGKYVHSILAISGKFSTY
jgi:hypothetical protein